MDEACESLRIERRDGGVLVLTLDAPPTNALDDALHRALTAVFEEVNRDDAARVVVLTGAGERAFSAGGDIDQMRRMLDRPEEAAAGMAQGGRLLNALLAVEKPIIARVNGHAIGLGATLALFCDMSYAVETARIGDPHVAVGLVAGDGGALIWPQLIGYARAREYLLTGDPIVARDAAAIGLITRAVPRDALDGVVYGMAARLAGGASLAVNLTKQAINLPLRRLCAELIETHLDLELTSARSSDHREAVVAFAEKRAPRFTGR